MPARLITDPKLVGANPNWTHSKDGMNGGKFGRIVHVAVCGIDGTFIFDRPIVEESPHVITLTYGVDPSDGVCKLALIKEARDTAARLNGEETRMFWGPPRGFAEQSDDGIIGAGRREAGEETGADVLTAEPWIVTRDTVPNETCVRSNSPWVAISVDLTKLSVIRAGRGEKIFKAEFFSAEEIEAMVIAGEHEGASTGSWCLMSALTLFRLHVLPKVKAQTAMAS